MRRSPFLRLLAVVAYGGLLVFLFAVAAYVSFSLFVRSGVTRTPDLSGLTREDAATELADSGLVWGKSAREGSYSDAVPSGHVLSQRPGPGSLVKRGSPVEVIISLGPRQLAVPDLRGLTREAAQAALAASGLRLGRTLSVITGGASAGTVVEQRPAAAAAASGDGTVDVLLALAGEDTAYVMPDLIYHNLDEVRRFFDARGFRLANVRAEPYEGIPEGAILRQSPLAGHPVGRHDAISLVVAARR